MTTVAPRSPALRILRNLCLLWMGLSLLGLLIAVIFVIYAATAGCTEGSWLRSDQMSWFGCTMASMVPILGAIASLSTATVVLFFVQLFYLAGMQVREGGRSRPRWFSREALFDEALDEAVDVTDILD